MGLTSIKERDLSNYPHLRRLTRLDTPEDVATLIKTYMDVRNTPGVDFRCIKDVYEEGNNYVCVLDSYATGWDILDFINRAYDSRVKLTGSNIGYIFPESSARREIGIEMRGTGTYGARSSASMGMPSGFRDYQTGRTINVGTQYIRSREFLLGRKCRAKLDFMAEERTNPGEPPKVSKTHCRMYYDRGGFFVEDSKSTNGTFVNGEKLRPFTPKELHIGDKVKLANYELEII